MRLGIDVLNHNAVHRNQVCSAMSQIIKRRLVKEAVQAAHSSSGLHAVVSRKSSLHKAEWVDIGATTVPDVAGILQLQQPLTWEYLTSIAARKPRVRKGVVCVRKNRPVELVSIFISSFLPGEVIHKKGSEFLKDSASKAPSCCQENPIRVKVWQE